MKIIFIISLQGALLVSVVTASAASATSSNVNYNTSIATVYDDNTKNHHHDYGNQSQFDLLQCAHYEVAAGECLVYEKISDVIHKTPYNDESQDDDDIMDNDDILDEVEIQDHSPDVYDYLKPTGNNSTSTRTTTTSTYTSNASPTELRPFDDLWDHFHCHHVEQRLTDETMWTVMRQIYRSVVGPEESSIPPPSRGYNGMTVPYRVAFSPGKGRGIFANANIARGTMIWAGIMMATFNDGYKYMEYLERLATTTTDYYAESRPDLVCNAILWTEVLPVPYPHGDLKIVVNLDEGALCNDGANEDAVNVVVDHELEQLFPATSVDRLFASDDIQKGDELLCDYASYGQEDYAWDYFGMAKKEESDDEDAYYDDDDDDAYYDDDDDDLEW